MEPHPGLLSQPLYWDPGSSPERPLRDSCPHSTRVPRPAPREQAAVPPELGMESRAQGHTLEARSPRAFQSPELGLAHVHAKS